MAVATGLGHDAGVTITHLFVYGTLRPGDVRWPLLEPFLLPDATTIDDARSLFDAARVALVVGALDAAERGYRLLVARSSLLGSVADRRIANPGSSNL